MKNIFLCILSVILLTFVAAPAHAGFAVKKHAISQTTAIHTTSSIQAELSNVASTFISEYKQLLQSDPQSLFARWTANGTVGIFALLFGILGLLAPIFALGAVLFGFLGIKKTARSKGLAIAGLVLGVVAIFVAVFGVYTPIF